MKSNFELARDNAAALIEAMDLEQLFGADAVASCNEDGLGYAQQQVVDAIRLMSGPL